MEERGCGRSNQWMRQVDALGVVSQRSLRMSILRKDGKNTLRKNGNEIFEEGWEGVR
jgi:hypothetical protein